MIITTENAQKTVNEKFRGGEGVLHGIQFINPGSRPNPTRVAIAAVSTLPKGSSIGFHAHETNEEIFFILDGQGVWTEGDGSEHVVAKGDFAMCQQGGKHGIGNREDAPLVFAHVVIDAGQ